MAKKTKKKTTVQNGVSKGRKAVLSAYKVGKIDRHEWFSDEGYPVCPISTYACAYGLKPEMTKFDDGGGYYVDDRKWVAQISKFFGIKSKDVEHLADQWDNLSLLQQESGSELLKDINLEEIALGIMIDTFEKKVTKKTVIRG